MHPKKKICALALGTLLIAAAATVGAATTPSKIINLQVKVTEGTHVVGIYQVKPAQTIPTHSGTTYTLTLLGTAISGGKTTTVPVNATFEIHAGKGRIDLTHAGSDSVDVKVIHQGRQGNQIKYTVGSGYEMRSGLATGFINLD